MATIRSIAEFILAVKSDCENWQSAPWFRGEPEDTPAALLPRIYREADPKDPNNKLKFNENQLVQFFRMKAPALLHPSIVPPREYNDQWLFLMRHFELPTRLLDWTEGALIALFFAFQPPPSEKPDLVDRVVWMLNPCLLNGLTYCKRNNIDIKANREALSKYDNDEFPITWGNEESPAHKNIQAAWGHGEGCCELPIAVHPTSVHPRLTVQRSCFTVHGSKHEGLTKCISDEIGPDGLTLILRKHTIDASRRDEILKDLKLLGISYTNAFPDIEGLSKELRTSSSNMTFRFDPTEKEKNRSTSG